MQDLKSRCDITDIVSSYVNLKRRGKNMVGLCPFHNEKSPSFNVYPENNSFYCFGCGAGGDVITFIRKIENLDYIEAVKMLADRVGLQMPEQGVDDSDEPPASARAGNQPRIRPLFPQRAFKPGG